MSGLPTAYVARALALVVHPEAGFGMPRDVSTDGHRIDFLINVTHVFNLVLFAIVCGWIGWACLRHTARRREIADYDLGSSKRSVVLALCLSSLIFLVVDGNLFVRTLSDVGNVFWNFRVPADDPRTVRIEINAHQWAWDGRYAGADGKFGTDDDVVVWNDFTIPVNTPVYIQLSSTDVVHSLYLPNFRAKMDAVPGQVNALWFQAKETGEFEIACAQHCGTNHYKMRGLLRVVTEDVYRRWHAEASENARRSYDPEDGAAHWAWEWKEHRTP